MPFQNRTLEKLFKGILQDQAVEFRHDVIDRSQLDQAVSYLPLTLSERQKDALYNAWQQEISYIQGPPGTGKSFTIVAIMISAVLLNKKVLFVSQKKAAIGSHPQVQPQSIGSSAQIYDDNHRDLYAVLPCFNSDKCFLTLREISYVPQPNPQRGRSCWYRLYKAI